MTDHLKRFDFIAGIIGRCDPPVEMFVTAREWRELVQELKGLGPSLLTDKGKSPWNNSKFNRLIFREHCLTIINSGSDDRDVCWAINRRDAERCHFRQRYERFCTRKSWLEQSLKPGEGGRPFGGIVTQAMQGPVAIDAVDP